MHGIYELKETLCNELEEYGNKGKLDVGGLEIVDKLAHTIKNLDKIIENYEDNDYSRDTYAYDDMNRDDMRHDTSMMRDRRYSRARGRGANARRDSMGRYSSDNNMMVNELRDLMEDAPDERTKSEIRKLVTKLESM